VRFVSFSEEREIIQLPLGENGDQLGIRAEGNGELTC